MHSTETKEQLAQALKTYWGYDSFHELQLSAMQAVLDDRDSLVVLPTGGGKSLCYQAPVMCRSGMAVVISPLISLMKDQVDSLSENGIPAAFINSTLSDAEKWNVAAPIRSKELKLVYIAPERISAGGKLLDLLEAGEPAFFAIDEAHCVSQWGHDFRPHYRELKILRERFPGVGMHAYTATATQRVRDDVIEQLGMSDPEVLIGNFDRPNLFYRITRREEVLSQLQEVIQKFPNRPGIVYCISRKEVERVTMQLQEMGYRAAAYHAGIDDSEREKNQNAFIKDEVQIIVATVAFGMGIDKPDVRFVVHVGIPKTIENYQQETGRAGRDGLDAECHLFFGGNDLLTWKRIVSNQPEALLRASNISLQLVSDYCHSLECRHKSLVRHFGQELEGDCRSACDVCSGMIEFDEESLVHGQMILSSVFRQGERFATGHTVRVLKGSSDAKILQHNHQNLSTYGLLKSESKNTVQTWIGQLVGQGFLRQSGEFGVLEITELGRELLKGERVPRLSKPEAPKTSSTSSKTRTTRSMEGVDEELFELLRALRTEKAKEKGVPPYVVFGDAALIDMTRRRPSDEGAFLLVSGVGRKKCEEYADEFLSVIRDYCENRGLPLDVDIDAILAREPVHESPATPSASGLHAFPFFEQGLSINEVAKRMGRSPSTAEKYLIEYLRSRSITDPTPWVERETAQRIEAAIEELQPTRLKPLFLHFEETIEYPVLRIVSECYRNRERGA